MRGAVLALPLWLGCAGASAPTPSTPVPAVVVHADALGPEPTPPMAPSRVAICASTSSVDDCVAAALEALAGGDLAGALASAHRVCAAPGSSCWGPSHAPAPGSAAALELVYALACACADGGQPTCVLSPLGRALFGDAEAACAAGDCDALATLFLLGYGVPSDVAAAARVSDRASYHVRVAIFEAGGALLPIPLGEPPASEAARLVTITAEEDPPGGEYVGWDGERSYYLLGFPAISSDGRVVAAVRSDGDGTNGEYELVSLDVESGAAVRRDPLSERHASEEESPEEAARFREARAAIVRASRYVTRRGLRSLAPLSAPDEPALAGVPILEWTGEGWVTIRDPSTGRLLFRERMVVLDPPAVPPEDLDDEARDQWDVDHWCDVSVMDDAAAWRIDATHVLIETRVNPPPDECSTYTEHAVVRLSGAE